MNRALRQHLYKNGISLVGIASIEERVVLRLLVAHPDYAFYCCLAGRIGVEHFMINDSGLERVSSKIMQSGEYLYSSTQVPLLF